MTKVVRRKKATVVKKEPVIAISHSLTQLYYDIDTTRMTMRYMSDTDLYDYCMSHIDMYKHKELDSLYPKLVDGQKLSSDERKGLEAFCILANTNLYLKAD